MYFNKKIKLKILILVKSFLRPKGGKFSFLYGVPRNSKILDIGCGNNSPILVKTLLPDSYYVGIDIENHNNNYDVNKVADEYILSKPEKFVESIKSLESKFDVIISSHNLEHCNDRYETLKAMIHKLNVNGKLYISFPSQETINFPKRKGCLNYYDDPTHKNMPPDFDLILEILRENDLRILFSIRNFKPFILNSIGHFTELISKYTKKIYPGVWEKWGFESIIIAEFIN